MKEVILFILFFGLMWLCSGAGMKACKEWKIKYQQPDTTLTYKNGKWDTVITKKSLPSWAK